MGALSVSVDEAARGARVRPRVVEIYAAAAADWNRAAGIVGRSFRSARELRSHERRFASEAVYGMIRGRRRYAFEATGADDAPPDVLYLVWLLREIGDAPSVRAELSSLGVDLRELDTAGDRLERIADPIARLAVRESYPDWIVRRLVAERGLDETARLCAAMNRRAPLTARANRLKNTAGELVARLKEEGVIAHAAPLAEDGVVLDTHLNAFGLAAFREGRFELQDVASQCAAELVAPPPRGSVLDACAGAGGKTLALGARLANRGRLVALDVSERKLEELKERARRAGLTNVQALLVDEFFARGERTEALPLFDRVLCDAPCSGLGVIRRHPETRWRLQPGELDELPGTQRAILDRYAERVAPGGRLIYATCTVTAVENDQVVDGFLAAHPSFEEAPAKEILGSERALAIGDGRRLRLLPHVHDTDGFFAAVLRRKA
jgi:16S rRNA (cytosine967-C5)-methyltransferase